MKRCYFVVECDGMYYIMNTDRDPEYYAERVYEADKFSQCANWVEETNIRECAKLDHRCPGAPSWM